MHANNEVGTLNPIDKISELCNKYQAYFHSDTVQSVGHIALDVSKLNLNFPFGNRKCSLDSWHGTGFGTGNRTSGRTSNTNRKCPQLFHKKTERKLCRYTF